MALPDITPGELNKLLVEGTSRQITSDDIDATGRGLYRHHRIELNRLIETNLFAGMTKFKAQVLTKSVERRAGPGFFRRLLTGDDTSARYTARIRIPEIHQSIPHPNNYPVNSEDYKTFMMGHPVAIYETTDNKPLNPGDIVWVVFEKGAGGSRFYQPVIESVYSRGTQAGDTQASPTTSQESFSDGTPVVSELGNLSQSQLDAIANEDLDDLDTCEKALRLHEKLTAGGMTEAMSLGMVGNAYSESGFQPEIGGDCGSTSEMVAILVRDGNLPSGGSRQNCCSWGLWQNNVCVSTSGGTQLLRYFLANDLNVWLGNPNNHSGTVIDRRYGNVHDSDTGTFYTDFKNWLKADAQNAQKAVSTLLNEENQITYALFFANNNKAVNGTTYAQAEKGFTPIGYSAQLTGAAACNAWWLQVYEQAAGYETAAKVNSRISDMNKVIDWMSGCSPQIANTADEYPGAGVTMEF